MAYSIYSDVSSPPAAGRPRYLPFLLLGVAMLIALGFEFVNGFHDTANAVATVIYTHALKPQIAVVWSGCCNLLGVLAVERRRRLRHRFAAAGRTHSSGRLGAGYAMVFALLIAAIIWNLGTWWLGLPASSSHTLIGSIVGVGIANALMRGADGTSGVDWSQVTENRRGAAALAAVRLHLRRAAAAGHEVPRPRAALYTRADRQHAAAAVDPRPAGPDLHRRFVLPWLQRRPEGHGPDHADPDRRRADGLRAEPARRPDIPDAFIAAVRRRFESRPGAGRRLRRSSAIRDPAVTDYVHAHQISEGTYPSLAVMVKQIGDEVEAVRLARQDAARQGGERPQRHVSGLRGYCAF